jgi:hypothetical protein
MSKALELADSLKEAWVSGHLSYDVADDAAAELRRLAAVEAAARNLAKVKGRYHTEQAYKALQDALGETK